MTSNAERERCETCRFWKHFWDSSKNGGPMKGRGQCRKLTPTFWCNTTSTDWCGEYEADQ